MKPSVGTRVVTQPRLTFNTALLVIITTASLGHFHRAVATTTMSRTFHSIESYAVYPHWLASIQGRCEFHFRTSQEDGVLLYIDRDGEQPPRYLYMELTGGQISVEIKVGSSETLKGSFGEHLNDNTLHKVTIVHNNKQFTFLLNNTNVADLQYDNHLSFESRSHTFFGGIAPTHLPDLFTVLRQVSFIGCLESIEFANDTSDAFSLDYQPPFDSRDVAEGCEDPCQSQGGQSPCRNSGTCLSLWEGEGRALCDCRDTSPLRVGQTCTEGVSAHQLLLTDGSFFCYNIPHNEPYTGEANTARIRLVPPVASHGTIMTGVSSADSPTDGFFQIHLQEWRVFLEVWTENTLITHLVSLKTLFSNTRYQLDFQQRADYVELIVWRVSDGSLIQHERMNSDLQTPVELVFDDVCVGGGLLEVPNYQGTLEYVFFKHLALAEQQNIEYLNKTRKQKSDVIRFVEGVKSPPLTLSTVGFGEWDLSFGVRTDPLDTGMLVYSLAASANDSSEFGLVKYTNMLFAIVTSPPFNFVSIECGFIPDNDWHNVDIYAGSGSDTFEGLVISIDGVQACNMTNISFRTLLTPLLGAPFELGKTSDKSSVLRLSVSVPFVGCLQDITFQRGSVVVTPNLEAAAREHERFETSGCFHCTDDSSQAATRCQNGGSCLFNRGYEDIECSCLPGFLGPTCTGPQPSPTTVTPEIGSSGTNILPSLAIGTTPPPVPTPTSNTDTPTMTGSEGTETPTLETEERSEGNSGAEPLQIGMWVAAGVGGVLILILAAVIGTLIILIYKRSRSKERGFYRTQESGTSIPHYNTSQQKVSSHAVGLDASNGNVATINDRIRDREFFI